MTSKQLGKLYADLKRVRREHPEATDGIAYELLSVTNVVAKLGDAMLASEQQRKGA